jgi:hypothetical protein
MTIIYHQFYVPLSKNFRKNEHLEQINLELKNGNFHQRYNFTLGELAVGHCQSRKLGATHLHSRYLLRDTVFSFTLASGHRRPIPPSTGERNFAK